MKRKTVFMLVVGAMILLCAGYSSAAVLGTIESSRAGSDLSEFAEMNFSICYPLLAGGLGGYDWSISLSWDVTPDDVGKTFFASADTYENFDVFTYPLTNGIDNLLYLTDGTISKFYTGTPSESMLINGIQDGVDLEGYTIDSISLTINELFFDYGGFPTNYSYDITYSINGSEMIASPEPATVLLLGLGGLFLRKKR